MTHFFGLCLLPNCRTAELSHCRNVFCRNDALPRWRTAEMSCHHGHEHELEHEHACACVAVNTQTRTRTRDVRICVMRNMRTFLRIFMRYALFLIYAKYALCAHINFDMRTSLTRTRTRRFYIVHACACVAINTA